MRVDFDVKMLAEFVNFDPFWERAYKTHYKFTHIEKSDINFKCAYLSRYLSNYLETFSVGATCFTYNF